MASSNPLFIIVPGSFATPASYDTLAAALQSKGQDVQVIPLPSANDGSVIPPPTFEDDIAAIRAAALAALDSTSKPRDVVLAFHSYSGVPGTSAAEGLSRAARSAAGKATAVTGLVYIGSFVPEVGQSLRSIQDDFSTDGIPEPYKTGIPGGYLPPVPAEYAPMIFNDFTDADEIQRLNAMFTLHASDTYSGTATYEAWKEIPSVQIIPEKDMIIQPVVQEKMHEAAVAAGGKVRRVFVEGAGHAITASRPELVAEEMIRQAEEGRK